MMKLQAACASGNIDDDPENGAEIYGGHRKARIVPDHIEP